MSVEELIARAFQVLVALAGAYTVALWFSLVLWTFRDIEARSRSVVSQVFSTLVVVLFFLPGVLIYLILRPKQTLDEAFARSLEEEYLLQDLEDLSLCPTCNRPVRDEFVVCPTCYTELRHACPVCAKLVDLSWAICPFCTAELGNVDAIDAAGSEEVGAGQQRPALFPLPRRLLHERMRVRVEHSMGMVDGDEDAALADDDTTQPLIARETSEAKSWVDDTGKQSWILTRAREVFRPLRAHDAPLENNGHLAANDDLNQAPPVGADASPDRDYRPFRPLQPPADQHGSPASRPAVVSTVKPEEA